VFIKLSELSGKLRILDNLLNNQKSMPISSQANSEELEGSETRVYDPERIMKLQERLEKIKNILKSF